MILRSAHAILAASLLAACAGSNPVPQAPGFSPGAFTPQSRWIPAAGDSYQIQYSGRLNMKNAASIYDLDMFDTSASTVTTLHRLGRRVVCYVDVGTWENWRPDAKEFPARVLGEKDGHWKGERWLDVRATSILEPIMGRRLDLCKKKGFDGVDPDNLDGYQNDTGFRVTYGEQLAYDTWVAKAAHDRGLTAAQKGDDGQVNDLVKVFDYAVVEQCFAQGWCKKFNVYSGNNRLVVDVEYYHSIARFQQKNCPEASQNRDTAILKRLQLTAWIVTCQ